MIRMRARKDGRLPAAVALFTAVFSGCAPSSGSSGWPVTAGPTPRAVPGSERVYVGSTDGQISIYKLDALGALTLVNRVDGGNRPSFLAFDPARAHAYAVNEADGTVASFAIDQTTGDLKSLNRVDSGGDGPAFVAVDRSGRYVMVANYGGGTTRIFPIGEDGSLGTPSDDKTPGEHSHMIITDPANKFAFVMNLGSDTVAQYAFDVATGTLSPNAVPVVRTAKDAGPRHLAFHPNGKLAYLLGELDHTVSAYSYDAARGRLAFLQTLSSVPAGGDAADVSGAEVVVAPSGRFVYSSNRAGSSRPGSIATFAVDAETGKLRLLGVTPSGGNVPRSFTLSADGKLMLVANESGNVVSFAVNTASGALSERLSIDVPQKPQFVGIVGLAATSPR
jgi:6-phosphogluconolactonase